MDFSAHGLFSAWTFQRMDISAQGRFSAAHLNSYSLKISGSFISGLFDCLLKI
jgi:hypothetical protein